MTQANALDAEEERRLIRQASTGDQEAWARLLNSQRDRLRAMLVLRLDRRLQARIDPSDVIQEACIVAARELPTYASNPTISFYPWLRWITGQRLVEQYRRHLGADVRDVERDVSLSQGRLPEATTAGLAAHLLGQLSTPSQAAMRAEQRKQLQGALSSLEPLDREILALRHFEGLTNGAAAEVLGIDKSAASKRYGRALLKLKDLLMPAADSPTAGNST